MGIQRSWILQALIAALCAGSAAAGEPVAPPAVPQAAAGGGCAAMEAPKPRLAAAPGAYRRAVTTASPEAQAFFDQGLRQLYAAQADAAVASFRAAAQTDKSCALCFWGLALALTPGPERPAAPERLRAAYQALAKARITAAGASPVEQALVAALARRVPAVPPGVAANPALERAYAEAMRQAAARFPADPDVQALLAEALIALPGGEPGEARAALDRALAVVPDHPGALRLAARLAPAAS